MNKNLLFISKTLLKSTIFTVFVFIVCAFGAQVVYADYASLQTNDCTLITEFTGETGREYLINATTVCSPYNLIGTTTPVSIQVFGKCTNGDIYSPRFDVFTYSGVRGSEIGGSKIYQEGENFPLFTCDNINRNVNGVIKMPVGTNESFFVVVSDASSSAPVVDLFENGVGSFTHALIHFDVKSGETSLSAKAAALAKELINYPYLWGGKGWDYNQNLFVSADAIKTGYHFYNSSSKSVDLGAGVDCSGLVMWSYNRSFDPTKPPIKNVVLYEGADGQYRNNSEPIAETALQPGDAMFFDWNGDGYIDHTAMYVGDSGNFNVVNAKSRDFGIVTEVKNNYKQLAGFNGFRRIHEEVIDMEVTVSSPIDITVTDPDGFTIAPDTIIPSDEEYIREIPGILYYSELERGDDENPIDRVYSSTLKIGNYTIKVIPSPGSLLTDTYTLRFRGGSQTITLAENIPINQIASEGYGVAVTETGTIIPFVPIVIDIKLGSFPNSINLNSKGATPVAVFGNNTFDVYQINLGSITLAGAPIKLKNNGQPMTSYEDVNGDGFTDIVVHVVTKALQLAKNDVKAELDGRLLDGIIIKGSDSVRIVP